MACTDRHFRVVCRAFTKHALLYSEMVTTSAVLHGDRPLLLGFSPTEHPLSLQLGGDDPTALAECARVAADWGYDEVNLNVGCPSERVQSGNFGACLMLRPDLVVRCVEAMRAAVDLPVTVKHRIGVDAQDSYADLRGFVDAVADAGADRFSVHARKAWLSGLSPKQNRTVPPLRYADVYRLRQERPDLVIELNGGVLDLDAALEHLRHVDAVMIGRAAYDDPSLLGAADRRVFGDGAAPDVMAEDAVGRLADYVEQVVREGGRAHFVTRHLLGLFAGRPGVRRYRQILSTEGVRPGAGAEVLARALGALG